MKIIIGADIVPTKTNTQYFESGDMKSLLGEELFNKVKGADYRIFNLEVPLTDVLSPIEKRGPNLIASSKSVNGYKALGVDLLTLANNHILDQGEQGLESTISALEEANIKYVGAGKNLSEARKPYIIEDNGKKIGIYACAEHEFTIAEQDLAGANPFDALESLDHIADLKKQCDYVIVLYHGGKEHYRYPSPNLQKVCRKICEKGADLVVCQHSHCVGCEEKYNGSTIVYGQGNFLFDYSKSEFWQTSLLIDLDTETKGIAYIPLRKEGFGVRLAEGDEIIRDFYFRSEQIKEKDFIKKHYTDFAQSMKKKYLMSVCGVNIIFRVINKLCGHRLKFSIPRSREMAIKNFLICEAHNELFTAALTHKKDK